VQLVCDHNTINRWNEKALRRTQTLHAENCTQLRNCIKAEPKKFTPPQNPFPGERDGQNSISWRCWSYLYLQTQSGEDRCMQFRVIVVTDPQTDRTDYNTLQRSLARSVKMDRQKSYSYIMDDSIHTSVNMYNKPEACGPSWQRHFPQHCTGNSWWKQVERPRQTRSAYDILDRQTYAVHTSCDIADKMYYTQMYYYTHRRSWCTHGSLVDKINVTQRCRII